MQVPSRPVANCLRTRSRSFCFRTGMYSSFRACGSAFRKLSSRLCSAKSSTCSASETRALGQRSIGDGLTNAWWYIMSRISRGRMRKRQFDACSGKPCPRDRILIFLFREVFVMLLNAQCKAQLQVVVESGRLRYGTVVRWSPVLMIYSFSLVLYRLEIPPKLLVKLSLFCESQEWLGIMTAGGLRLPTRCRRCLKSETVRRDPASDDLWWRSCLVH